MHSTERARRPANRRSAVSRSWFRWPGFGVRCSGKDWYVLNTLEVWSAFRVTGAWCLAEHPHREPVMGCAPLREHLGKAAHGVADLLARLRREVAARHALLECLLEVRQAVHGQGAHLGDVVVRGRIQSACVRGAAQRV